MLATQNISIKHKLILITMLTCVVALLSAAAGFIVWEWTAFRRTMVQNLSTQAEMIAENCKASLAFQDAKDAEKTLSALHVEPSIVFGCVYTKDGKFFATYYRDFAEIKVHPPEFMESGFSFGDGFLTVFKPIVLDGATIGTVCLRSDLRPMYVMLKSSIFIIIAVLSFASLVAYLVSTKIRRIISSPILNLADVAKVISEKKDYSTRAVKSGNDEVGLLIDAFNEMLGQIQQRDFELVDAKVKLEMRVKERTAELSTANEQLKREVAERKLAQVKLQQYIKQLNCLYGLSKLAVQPQISLDQIFQETTEMIRSAYRYPDITCVRVTFNGIQYKTDNFQKTEHSQWGDILVHGGKAGSIEVYCLEEKPEDGEGPFLKEEGALLDAVCEKLSRIAELKQATDKLRLFRSLIDQSNDCIFILEPKWGRFLDVNDRACESLRYSRKELLEMSIKDIEEFPEGFSWQQRIEELKLKGDIIIQGQHKCKDGTRFFAETSLKFVKEEKEDYIIAIARDITERKKMEEAQKQLVAIIEATPDFVGFADAKDKHIIYVNKAGRKMCGIGNDEDVTKLKICDVHPEWTNKMFAEEILPAAVRDGTWEGECAFLNIRDRHEIPVLMVLSSHKASNGEVEVFSTISRDITERKRAEKRQAELLKEVESVNHELKDFAYVASHDLKAPLRGIKTLAEWLSADYADKLGEQGKEQMGLLLRRVERMHNLIEGILQYSRVGRVTENLAAVNLNKLMPEIIDTLAPPENITITVENELPTIESEPTRIGQVFQNLMSNAVKYMDKPQGQIKVSCVEEDGFWKFGVADNGPGIEEKYFERIFQIFQTLSSRDDFESTGIGLTITKKIVELYGGKIWVESKVGEGSTFFFTLPKKEMGVKDAKLEASVVS